MRFTHQNHRLSGIVVPLSSIRGEDSPGCGEFPDLADIGHLAAEWKFNLVQLLPVNDSGSFSAPYFALSAFALNPIYLRIGDLPDLPASGALREENQALIKAFAGRERSPYEELRDAKLALLRKIWADCQTSSRRKELDRELDAWIGLNPWIKAYAAFVVVKARNGDRPWWEWERFRDPGEAEIEELWSEKTWAPELRFWAWLQLRSTAQFAQAARKLADSGIELMGDIPILMNKDSADVWARRQFFNVDLSAGAPPDMYAALGQNWGFPIYDWSALEREGYSFWNERLVEAAKYYSCYRIDHVLGFFRIWSLSARETSGFLGRFVPDVPITRADLNDQGFSPERIRWLSRPHIPFSRLRDAAGEAAARHAVDAALNRIGDQELFLFKETIGGEKDIEALPGLSPAARDCLLASWRDRVLYEYENGSFAATCSFRSCSAWPTLSDDERSRIEGLVSRKGGEAESLWERTGRRLLGILSKAVDMLPCAEDLGSVPDCVPRSLQDLGILGLRVFRWTRQWNAYGQPYVPANQYPELSVSCPSVHDSSSLREWWTSEADRGLTWDFAAKTLGRDIGPCPEDPSPEQVEWLLEVIALTASRFAVYPIQDLLGMSEKLRAADPRGERINVPGTVGPGNWSYRIPWTSQTILADKKLGERARALAKLRSSGK